MKKIRLGKTNLIVSHSGFGAIPLQRLDDDSAARLLHAAFEGGINFYDTARGYSTSEYRIGHALADVRDKIIIATKTHAQTGEHLEKDLAISLAELGTYIDIYQFHNPSFTPRPGGADGLYDAMLKAKAEGKIKHIGISSHLLELAKAHVKTGLFDTMQFPLSALSTNDELELIALCKEYDVGFIAMKGLAGGVITNAKPTFAYLRQFDNVVPIWGIEHMWQLTEFLEYEKNPPTLNEEMWAIINKDRAELAGDFCRGCGYCQPCPAGIIIQQAARMKHILGRTALDGWIGERGQAMMRKINGCTNCGHCKEKCPYKLDVPNLLHANLAFYEEFIQVKKSFKTKQSPSS